MPKRKKLNPKVFGRILECTHSDDSIVVWAETFHNVSVFVRCAYPKKPRTKQVWSWSCASLPQMCDNMRSAEKHIEARMRELVEAFGPYVGWEPSK